MLAEPDAQLTVGVVERHLYPCVEPVVNVLLSLLRKPDLRRDKSKAPDIVRRHPSEVNDINPVTVRGTVTSGLIPSLCVTLCLLLCLLLWLRASPSPLSYTSSGSWTTVRRR